MPFKSIHFKSLNVFVSLFFFSLLIGSCSKDDDSAENDSSSFNPQGFTLYKNLTGDPGADALQAHYEDNDHSISIYGTFNNYDEPAIPKTVTFQKKNNDTIVNLILDPLTSRISSSFISVRGEKAPIVMKFAYPEEGSTDVSVSLYEYNWVDHTGELFFNTTITGETGEIQDIPGYPNSYPSSTTKLSKFAKSSKSSTNNVAWVAGGVGAGIAAAEAALALGLIGGKSLVAAAAATTTASAVAAVAVPVAVAGAIGITLLTLTAIINDANASELIPSDGPYPDGVPIHNPIPEEEDPTSNLEESECNSVNIKFSAFMNKEGTVVIRGMSGGAPPYTYFVNNDVQETQIFGNDYPDGKYFVTVKDSNGCMKSMLLPLSRENPLIGTWRLTTYAGEPLGTPIPYYMEECPEIQLYTDYLYRQTLYFTEDTFTGTVESSYIDLNRSVDHSSCEIKEDEPDTDHPRETDRTSGTYIFTGNTLTLNHEDDPEDPVSITIQFLNEDKTKFIVPEDSYEDIWEKQE